MSPDAWIAAALRLAPPEAAHETALTALALGHRAGLLRGGPARGRKGVDLGVTVAGLRLANPIGLAAGFDKDARVPDAACALGFGFVECGTVTPRPQPGNPKPRVFRLPPERGLINRLGFNSAGFEPAAARLTQRLEARGRASAGHDGVVGVNLGANKDSEDRAADYVEGLERFWALADYFTINVSSPNTPGLRALQQGEALADLLARLGEAKARLIARASARPVFLKLAPDLDAREVAAIVEAVRDAGSVDGLIIANTTLARPPALQGPHARETGGLSGRPVFARSTRLLAQFRRALGPDTPLIGVGGVDSGEAAYAKIRAGASAVQLYTGLVYGGPFLARRIARALSARLAADGHGRVSDAIGVDAVMWTDP